MTEDLRAILKLLDNNAKLSGYERLFAEIRTRLLAAIADADNATATRKGNVVQEWYAARAVIATALGEWYGGSPSRLHRRADEIIDRLESHSPPILLTMKELEP